MDILFKAAWGNVSTVQTCTFVKFIACLIPEGLERASGQILAENHLNSTFSGQNDFLPAQDYTVTTPLQFPEPERIKGTSLPRQLSGTKPSNHEAGSAQKCRSNNQTPHLFLVINSSPLTLTQGEGANCVTQGWGHPHKSVWFFLVLQLRDLPS